MPVENMAWAVVEEYAALGGSHSIQVNFGPTMAVAQVSLSAVSVAYLLTGTDLGELDEPAPVYGVAYISQYRTRTQPDGPDQDHNVGCYVAFDPLMTSATAGLYVGVGSQARMSMMVWLWS